MTASPPLSATALGLRLLAAGALVSVTGCAVGPNYRRPATPVATAFKEAPAGWKPASPGDAAERGRWWEVLQDPILNEFETQVLVSNQSLVQSAANYEVARQLARADRATLFPTISAAGSGQRARLGSGRGISTPAGSSSTTGTTVSTGAVTTTTGSSSVANTFSASVGATWTLDFFGRIRRLTESDVAAAQASAADLALARLATQSALAQDYIQLRAADERIRLRENAVAAYQRTLTIAQNKYKVGIVARYDVISAQTELDAARAQVIDAGVLRAQLEHAIAVLLGRTPAEFSIARQPNLTMGVPVVPAQLPSELLERRPDIAAAERNVAAANARVGIQTAAYFPTFTLSADGGYQHSRLPSLFEAPNRFWSLGADLGETLFDFGRRRAEMISARAAYDGTVANYRQTTLSAFAQVEDNLAALRLYDAEAQVLDAAVREAAEAARIALNEYNAGTVDFTTVATAQVTELNNRQSALTVLQNRLVSTVALIEALGGGWSTADLPTNSQVLSRTARPASER